MAIELTNPMNGDMFKAEVENALDKRGDVMLDGATLRLGKNPTEDMDATTKTYVDKNIKIISQTFTIEGDSEGIISNEYIAVGKIPNYITNKYTILVRSENRITYNGHRVGIVQHYSKVSHNNPVIIGHAYAQKWSKTYNEWSTLYEHDFGLKINENGQVSIGIEEYASDSTIFKLNRSPVSFYVELILIPSEEIELETI